MPRAPTFNSSEPMPTRSNLDEYGAPHSPRAGRRRSNQEGQGFSGPTLFRCVSSTLISSEIIQTPSEQSSTTAIVQTASGQLPSFPLPMLPDSRVTGAPPRMTITTHGSNRHSPGCSACSPPTAPPSASTDGRRPTFLAAYRDAGFRVVGHLAFPKRCTSSTRFLRYQHECAHRPFLQLPASHDRTLRHRKD